jgi:hypothetical protein
MPHRPWEESAQDPETPNPVTPTKPQRNAGASHDNPDAQNSTCQYDSNEPPSKKKRTRKETKKQERHLILYMTIELWRTGERAETNEKQIWFDIIETARGIAARRIQNIHQS